MGTRPQDVFDRARPWLACLLGAQHHAAELGVGGGSGFFFIFLFLIDRAKPACLLACLDVR